MAYKKSSLNFLFYDYESFGKNTKGALSQFAAIRTDAELNKKDVYNFYCKPSQDMVPEPEACLITAITPQKAEEEGYLEYDFVNRIHDIMTQQWQTVIVGYNNIDFDDEFTRNVFYRNLKDPYAWAWKQKNSRFDVSNLVRAVHALRPNVMKWPSVDKKDEDGNVVGTRISFKLEHLSAANGIVHDSAHDALSDVEALIGIMSIIKNVAPDLFDVFFNLRFKKHVAPIVAEDKFGFVSYKFVDNNYISLVKRLGQSTSDKNKVWGWDLRVDPRPFAKMSIEELNATVKMRHSELEEAGITGNGMLSIKVNAVPFVFNKAFFATDVVERAGLDLLSASINKNSLFLAANDEFIERLICAYEAKTFDEIPNDTDINLYCSKSGGFFSQSENEWIDKFTEQDTWKGRFEIAKAQQDGTRLNQMMFRVIGRNAPEVFDEEYLKMWTSYVSERLKGDMPNCFISLEQMRETLNDEIIRERYSDAHHAAIFNALEDYYSTLKSRL